jgi:hypothetical protein
MPTVKVVKHKKLVLGNKNRVFPRGEPRTKPEVLEVSCKCDGSGKGEVKEKCENNTLPPRFLQNNSGNTGKDTGLLEMWESGGSHESPYLENRGDCQSCRIQGCLVTPGYGRWHHRSEALHSWEERKAALTLQIQGVGQYFSV